MSGNIIREWNFWIVSIITGSGMAFLYDIIRLFRRLIRHGRFAVDFEDIIYWAACFVCSFVLLYYGNNGVIRFAAVFGAALGMFLYIMTLGRVFIKASLFIIDKTFGALIRFIGKIVRKLRKLLMPIKTAVHKYVRIKKIVIIHKYQLTKAQIRHNIIICHRLKSENKKLRKNRKGETNHGRQKKKKIRKKNKVKKNPEVSTRKE